MRVMTRLGSTMAFFACFLFLTASRGIAQVPLKEPGGSPGDVHLALFNPDEHAWRLFLFLNHQALRGKSGEVDSSKQSIKDYDADADVIWETWALSTGGEVNKSEVFKNPATEPIPWDQLASSRSTKLLSPNFKSSQLIRLKGRPSELPEGTPMQPFFLPGQNPEGNDESRMNRSTYETIIKHRLYSVEGLERKYAEAKAARKRSLLEFEQMSKEVKARWVKLEDKSDVKARYHWRTLEVKRPDGSTERQVWGLAGLHVITRDLPNWFWADFGHIDFERVATTEPRDTTTRGPNPPAGQNGVRRETVGSKWSNYILRGTQIDFIDTVGNPTILSNPLIEEQQQRSSCISCHSRATVAPRESGLLSGFSIPRSVGKVGTTNLGSDFDKIGSPVMPDFLAGTPEQQYLQTDFLWSIPFRAFSEKP